MAAASMAVTVALFAPYWVLQAAALTVIASAVAVDSIRRADADSWWEAEPSPPRSRVTHYAMIAGVEDSTRLIQTAANPFERSVLQSANWSALSPRMLAAHSRNTPMDDDSVNWETSAT